MKPLLLLVIEGEDIAFGGGLKKPLQRAVFGSDGRAILSSCFGLVLHRIVKALFIFRQRRVLLKGKTQKLS